MDDANRAGGQRERDNGGVRSVGIGILATLAVIAALSYGREFLAPIAMAMILNALFRPVIRWMRKLHFPAPLASAIVVLGLLAVLLGVGYALSVPIKGWTARAPETLAAANVRLERLLAPMRRLNDAASQVGQGNAGAPATAPSTTSQPTSQPATQSSTTSSTSSTTQPTTQPHSNGVNPVASTANVLSYIVGSTTHMVAQASGVLLLLFLLLASDGLFMKKLIDVLPASRESAAADAVHEGETIVLRYVVVTAIINIVQATIVALVMWWLGMPTPLLIGVFCFVFEFIPYLGAAIMIMGLTIVGLATQDSLVHILAAPGSYLLITTLQNNLVSPYAYGRRLNLNAVVVLIGVLFWWYVWGIAGAFMAVPILAFTRVVAERSKRFKPVATFLSE
jgi:predicted PurR-regulated permease PerM